MTTLYHLWLLFSFYTSGVVVADTAEWWFPERNDSSAPEGKLQGPWIQAEVHRS